MISNTRYWLLLFLISVVYIAGLFSTLFENDSAQFAVMAMRMVQENDFINLIKGTNEYLDKPHMHYWLAALSFKIFGLHDWAYRIPGMLAIFLGAYSCFGLGKLLYNEYVGKTAALIFLTSQTIVLSVIDVRTDAVLTGFTIFALWQLTSYINKNSLLNIVLGAFGAGIAFSTKGQIALVVLGLPILCHLAYTRKWMQFINWRVLVAILVFAITIGPILYAYYLQFDLHPEKIIRGRSNRSGIFFILWEQSFERMSGEGIGKNSSDYFFFFHTFLWVFLPWTVIGLVAYYCRVKTFIKLKFAYKPKYEFLTLGGITLIFILISFAQFKLPHYLNIIIPLFAILTASYLHSLNVHSQDRTIKIILGIQYFIFGLIFVVVSLFCFYVFEFESVISYVLFAVAGVIGVYFTLKREAYAIRIVTIAALASVLINSVLNFHFYPNLLEYQAGSAMAKVISKNDIPVDKIFKLSEEHTWSLDFYNQKPVQITKVEALEDSEDSWVYISEEELLQLRDIGFDWDQQYEVDDFRITRLQGRFLNPATRKKVIKHKYLIHIVN
ncbi:glycosyltransferase family 39 protein [Cellulophaga sp. HaHa_2_95]|uniref:ArnT family glycosyltransferase n=1 Tax=unclassified Cellulophaga TaxID=2634405 RepID=UPI001C4FA0FB|nr:MULTISPECIES: glycosyltransferase family 39 protein [unclassified Cellulophaga]QXP52093.1 glycosyltransferase family 39 protein [Cellulophaga sp. HaHa_2_1]QXP55583.1 glycosyltransferase family 39 protein [Cellulophaga sp. HaHa_2_95]